MEKKPILKIRLYRGQGINYDANGKIKNENNLVSLEYNTKEWVLFMKNLPLNGYCKVEVEKGFKQLNGGYELINDLSSYQKEVQDAFSPKQDIALTPEQKRIAELEAKLEAFMNGKKEEKVKPVKVIEKEDAETLNGADRDYLIDKYTELYGKKPFHGWSNEQLSQKIAEFTE